MKDPNDYWTEEMFPEELTQARLEYIERFWGTPLMEAVKEKLESEDQ